jgi:toxin CcdB
MTVRYFDVVANPIPQHRKDRPFYVCVQHTMLDHLRTRLMAPLLSTNMKQQSRLHPLLSVAGQTVLLDPTDLITMNLRYLGEPVANLESESFRIIGAIDLVLTGV